MIGAVSGRELGGNGHERELVACVEGFLDGRHVGEGAQAPRRGLGIVRR